MIINLVSITGEMGKIFIRNFMETAEHIYCRAGVYLFREGDATHYFYTLIQGEFQLTVGTSKTQVYTVRNPGDIFGWSSLLGKNHFSATATSSTSSEIYRFDRDTLFALLSRYPQFEGIFFKKLAEMLGNRLLESFQLIQNVNMLDRTQEDIYYLAPGA